MAYVFVLLLINLVLFWHSIDGIIIDCTVYPTILQEVPHQITGTISIANSSNEEIYWNHVEFNNGSQFPLKFLIVIADYKIISDTYIFQLHIYKLPRGQYDLPLWSADTISSLPRSEKPNSVIFHANSDRKPVGPCIMGVILSSQTHMTNLEEHHLLVKVGSMDLIELHLHKFMSYFPILFMVTDIQVSEINNSTLVTILLENPKTIMSYEAKERAVFGDSGCTTLLFRVSEEKTMNLTVTMSAHVFTSISLLSLAATYRIYRAGYLLFERSELIETLEFPFVTHPVLVPITTSANYSIEATIFGPVAGFSSGMTLFEGATYARLVPGTNRNIKISMLYTGLEIGTTIIGRVYQTPSNLSTWSLAGSNLAFVLDDPVTKLAESDQFIIFDQTFPIQFTMLNVQSITENNQNVAFTVSITYLDGTVIWAATTTNKRIMYKQLNQLDIGLSIADGYACRKPGEGYCDSLAPHHVNTTCCSQFKCTSGQCKLPW